MAIQKIPFVDPYRVDVCTTWQWVAFIDNSTDDRFFPSTTSTTTTTTTTTIAAAAFDWLHLQLIASPPSASQLIASVKRVSGTCWTLVDPAGHQAQMKACTWLSRNSFSCSSLLQSVQARRTSPIRILVVSFYATASLLNWLSFVDVFISWTWNIFSMLSYNFDRIYVSGFR